eukprot:jgi/Botrbrau1/7236/Bobra.0021s0020.1
MGWPGRQVKSGTASIIWFVGLLFVVCISLGALVAWSQGQGNLVDTAVPAIPKNKPRLEHGPVHGEGLRDQGARSHVVHGPKEGLRDQGAQSQDVFGPKGLRDQGARSQDVFGPKELRDQGAPSQHVFGPKGGTMVEGEAATVAVPPTEEDTSKEHKALQDRGGPGGRQMIGGRPSGVPDGGPAPRPLLKPWEEEIVSVNVCTNTCAAARNGVCNDGRLGRDRVWCDLGTDCEDCGSWVHLLPASQAAQPIPTPVAKLVAIGVEVYVRDTVTSPSFRMSYTAGTQDTDVSAQLEREGLVEAGLTSLWWEVLNPRGNAPCLRADAAPGLVVDVGGNFGWYTLLAASLGCRVMVWEPVPLFRAFLEFGLQLNHLHALVDLHRAVVSPDPGPHKVLVPREGLWGMAGINGMNLRNVDEAKKYRVTAVGEQLDKEVSEEIQILKIDVEGYELSVMATAQSLFDEDRVRNLFLEYSPGVYETNAMLKEYIGWPRMLVRLQEWGFTLLHVPWHKAKGKMLPPNDRLDVITHTNLMYDLNDGRLLGEGTLGCPIPASLQNFSMWSFGCNTCWDAHPKSFRSTFSHNTNVFATKNTTGFKVGRPVGTFLMDQAEMEYFTRTGVGMFGQSCHTLKPISYLVRCRCPCPDLEECREEHRLAEEWARSHPPAVPNFS